MVGELVVARKVTLAASVTSLKRMIAMDGNRIIFIVTPLPRFLNSAAERRRTAPGGRHQDAGRPQEAARLHQLKIELISERQSHPWLTLLTF
jgi:hypothetical protein